MKSARIGWTKILGHVMGYHIHQDSCSLLMVQPTIEDAEGYSKEEIQPMVDETEVLRSRVGDSKSRSSDNTIMKKRYPGGFLHIIGANSPRGFRRITVRGVLFDECDGYPPSAGQEGDQIKLGIKRSDTFWNRFIGIGSTPTIDGISRIQDVCAKSSMGYYMLHCPHCAGEHIRKFRVDGYGQKPIELRGEHVAQSFLQWEDGRPETAAWVCPHCGGLIGHDHHHSMVGAGYWLGEHWEYRNGRFTFLDGFDGRIGFHIWGGYVFSPNLSPAKIAREFLDSKDDPEQLKTFVNTVLGETWTEKGETVNEQLLMSRREEYKAEVPRRALVITVGVDIQADRIEFEAVGWGKKEESWSIDYQILIGDTAQEEVWVDLTESLQQTYLHESGRKLPITGVCIDSGYLTKKVYDYIRGLGKAWVWPVKGTEGQGRPVVETRSTRANRLRKRRSGGVKPELIGVDEAKSILYRRLNLVTAPGPGYCHFPMDRDEEYFAQLTGEKLITRYRKGRPIREWMKIRPRNESLDCRVYAYAALKLINPRWEEMAAIEGPEKVPRKSIYRPCRSGRGNL